MKKNVIRIVNIIIILLIIITTGTTVFADDYRPEDLTGAPSSDVEKVQELGNQVVGVLQAIGTVVSVIVLIILGIKYMLGSIEQRAEYKKSMLPYVVGASILLAASVISNIIMHAVSF